MVGAVALPENGEVHEALNGLKLEERDDEGEKINGSAPDVDNVEVKKKKKKNKKQTSSVAVANAAEGSQAAPEVSNGNQAVKENGKENGNYATKESVAADDDEDVEGGGDEAAKKKKKPKSKKKKAGLKQTDPPSIPVADLFPLGDFSESEIQHYKDA